MWPTQNARFAMYINFESDIICPLRIRVSVRSIFHRTGAALRHLANITEITHPNSRRRLGAVEHCHWRHTYSYLEWTYRSQSLYIMHSGHSAPSTAIYASYTYVCSSVRPGSTQGLTQFDVEWNWTISINFCIATSIVKNWVLCLSRSLSSVRDAIISIFNSPF